MFNYLFHDIVSVKMNEKEIKYIMVIPGVAKENVNVTISNKSLLVETTKKTAFGEKFFYNDEYNYSKKYLVQKATSTLVDGVLTVTIPAKEIEKEQLRQITIE